MVIAHWAVAADDLCLRPAAAKGLVNFLNAKVGQPGGPSDRVLSIQQLVASGSIAGSQISSISCHGVLLLANGQSEAGTVRAADPGGSSPLQVSWESDVAMAQREAAVKRAWDWRSFNGNIATWTGIPPLPPSASSSESTKSPVYCTVADAADHMVSIWVTKKDCDEWINEAKELAESGPTPMQIEGYRREQCVQKLAAGMTQSYSGEFWELCAGIVPRP